MLRQYSKMGSGILQQEWFGWLLHSFASVAHIFTNAFQHGVQTFLLHFSCSIEVLHHICKYRFAIDAVCHFVQLSKELFVLHNVKRIGLITISLAVYEIYKVENEPNTATEVYHQPFVVPAKIETIMAIILTRLVDFF